MKMNLESKRIGFMLVLGIILCAICGSIFAHAQSANVVAATASADCSTINLIDNAGTESTQTNQTLTQMETTAFNDRNRLAIQMAFDDMKMAAASIGLTAEATCIANQQSNQQTNQTNGT